MRLPHYCYVLKKHHGCTPSIINAKYATSRADRKLETPTVTKLPSHTHRERRCRPRRPGRDIAVISLPYPCRISVALPGGGIVRRNAASVWFVFNDHSKTIRSPRAPPRSAHLHHNDARKLTYCQWTGHAIVLMCCCGPNGLDHHSVTPPFVTFRGRGAVMRAPGLQRGFMEPALGQRML